MDYEKYYEQNETYIISLDPRLKKIISLTSSLNPKKILDVGCGNGFLLNELSNSLPKSSLTGVDVYTIPKNKRWSYKKADITKGLPFDNSSFDCVIIGEVIEHVPDPDFLLKETYKVLQKNGTLIISTPNLVSWANRLLVLAGVQPLFTETSSEKVLGRFHPVLGQGGKVQGHLKIFTFKSLEELLQKEHFNVEKKMGVPFFFPFPVSVVDTFMAKAVPLASGLLYVARKK